MTLKNNRYMRYKLLPEIFICTTKSY